MIHVVDDLAATAGPLLADAIARTIRERGRCRLGLAGGSTPGPTFDWLAEHLPHTVYPDLWITWVDERVLPKGDPDRNDRLAARWLDRVPAEHVLPMDALDTFAAAFAQDFGGLDVALLGAGPDGHIASLFPGHSALDADGFAVAIDDSPKPPPARISLTLPVLRDTSFVLLLARGADKAPMLRRALAADPTLPLGRIRVDHWVVDRAAGEGLQ